METAKRVMPFGQTGILRKVSVIKTSQQNLRHLRPDGRTVRATTDWSVKGPPSKKKANRLNVQKWYRCCQRSLLHRVEVSRKRCLLKGRGIREGRSHLTLTTRIRRCRVNLKLTRLLTLSARVTQVWSFGLWLGNQLSIKLPALGVFREENQRISGLKFVKFIKAGQCARI